MQTFLPYPDYIESARVLDNKRLGKQRVETLQIMHALLSGKGWVHHPATLMWNGYEHELLEYQKAVCYIWLLRGYRDTCYVKTVEVYYAHCAPGMRGTPPWLGREEFHRSHQSNLIRKDPDHYGPHFPGVPDNLPYFWPTQETT